MKGVIMQVGDEKSIVMFNSGKLGAIPTRPEYQIGTVVDSSKRRIPKIFIILSAVILLLCGSGFAGYLYFTPFSYVQISVNPTITLSCNYFDRVVAVTPINADAVPIVAELNVVRKPISEAYQMTIEAFSRSGSMTDQNTINISIANDNLDKAAKLQEELSALSAYPVNSTIYTIDLYKQLSQVPEQEPTQTPSSEAPQEPEPADPTPSDSNPTEPMPDQTPPDTQSSSSQPPSDDLYWCEWCGRWESRSENSGCDWR